MIYGPMEYCEIIAHCADHPTYDLNCPDCCAEVEALLAGWADTDEENQG